VANALTRFGKFVAGGLSARSFQGVTAEEFMGLTRQQRTSTTVTEATALRNSAVWACLRLRADLISTFPCDVYRKVGDVRVEVPKPQVLVEPGGPRWDYQDWMYASQFDLDRSGNDLGLVLERDGSNRPALIELVALGDWSVVEKADTGEIKYRVRGKEYTPDQVWHERQYVVAGCPVGLSPVAHAAWVISEGLSIQQFAQQWFSQGAVPSAHLRNTQKTVPPKTALEVKERFKASVQVGDPFVSGSDWEYNPLRAEAMGSEWLNAREASLADIARFFGVPADLIDAAVSGQSITYANITQRNLQFLIMNLGPAVSRREKNLSKLTAKPRYVKLNTNSLLRMDPKTRAETYKIMIDARIKTNTEVRALEDDKPLTQAQVDEFETIYGPVKAPPVKAVS